MPKPKTREEEIQDIATKTDDLYWLLKWLQNSTIDEMTSDQIYAAFNCILRLLKEIRTDIMKLM